MSESRDTRERGSHRGRYSGVNPKSDVGWEKTSEDPGSTEKDVQRYMKDDRPGWGGVRDGDWTGRPDCLVVRTFLGRTSSSEV